MSQDPQQTSSYFSQIDISAGAREKSAARQQQDTHAQTELMQQILAALDRNNELLEEMVNNASASQRQRADELRQWREANPGLASSCKLAAEKLARVQSEFLFSMTQEIHDNAEDMEDGEFVFNEFVDRFGPRLAHLNGVLQMLSQLSNGAE